ncbi:MAG TPA: carboxypeptidase regulatory-like domain-containing protein [Vicinamibacterales bacterium]|nr:carboxypeptidase regulatory-like domain-containing protein [Vicinamibacterales bacterium]
MALIVAVLGTGALGAARLQQTAPRDASTLAPTVGTAAVSGIVVTDEEPGQPVRRAIVVLAGDGLRPTRSAITDDEGRFGFADLPAGKFTITVSRASFVTSMYGAKRAGRPGVPLVIGDGARVANVAVRLWRGAALAGTLRDEWGAPVAGIQVRAFPARARGPLQSLSNNGNATTDETGQFRIFGLEPGAYVVAALPPSGSSSPYVGLSDAQTDAALEALRRRTANAGAGAPASPPVDDSPPRPFGYASIFFPGTPVATQAATITVAAGESHAGLDFALQRVGTSIVSGVVMKPDGTPAAQASLQLTSIAPAGPLRDATRVELTATAGVDGSFRIAQVRPGDYELAARVPADLSQPGIRPGYIEAPSTPQLYAIANLSVAGGDVTGLALSVAPGINIRGRLAFESETKKAPETNGGSVWLIPEIQLPVTTGAGLVRSLQIPAAGRTRPDGTFEFGGVAPGKYWLMTSGAGVPMDAWQLRSAVIGGRDVLDGLVEVPAGSGPLELVMTYDDKPARLSGRLETASGAPASDVFVLAFAADRNLRGPYSRRIKAVRPGEDGSFGIGGLPAGDYLLAALTDADPEDWQNPEFLRQLEASCVKVSLIPGTPVVQNLRIGG